MDFVKFVCFINFMKKKVCLHDQINEKKLITCAFP